MTNPLSTQNNRVAGISLSPLISEYTGSTHVLDFTQALLSFKVQLLKLSRKNYTYITQRVIFFDIFRLSEIMLIMPISLSVCVPFVALLRCLCKTAFYN
jgi:hypothetical protein